MPIHEGDQLLVVLLLRFTVYGVVNDDQRRRLFRFVMGFHTTAF